MYTVKQAANILGVSVHTVRFYDDQGLIPGTKRNSANQRVFNNIQLEWLFISIILRNAGLSIAEVRHYIDLYQQGDKTLKERYEIMRERRNQTLQEMADLKQRLAVLDRKIEHYSKLLNGEDDIWDHKYMQYLIWKGKNDED